MGLVVAAVQQKGGVGKTALVTSLFGYLVSESVSVGLVDLDPQGNATAWALGHQRFLSVPQHGGAEAFTLPYGELARATVARSGGVFPQGNTLHELTEHHVFPCTKLGGGVVVPANAYMAVHSFTDFFADLIPADVVLIDTPPRLCSSLLRSIAAQAHAIVAPVQPEPHAVQNIGDLVNELSVGGQHLLDAAALRLVVTMRQKCANHDAHEKFVRQHWKRYVSPVVISRATSWGEMAIHDTPWKRNSAPAKSAAALWDDISKAIKRRAAA